MSLITAVDEVEYPESDGQPMGETDVHRDWMFRILELLRWRYRGERVYLASNLLVYYQKGVPRHFVVPDDFVVTDCDPGQRRTFKTWEEGKAPEVVFEVTSRSTRREDEVYKPRIYAQLGVHEFFLYDPTAEYLRPPLKGFRLKDGDYVPVEPDASGAIRCEHLGLTLRLDQRELQMFDSRSGQLLRTAAEAAADAFRVADAQRQLAEEQQRAAESARQTAEQRASELEAEIERLRRELAQKRTTS